MMTDYQLDPECCRLRQRRLIAEMQQLGCDVAILTLAEHVQWLTGIRYPWVLRSAVAILADGRAMLAAPNKSVESGAIDECVAFDAQTLCTLRNDQSERSLQALSRMVPRPGRRMRTGVEFSCFPRHFSGQDDEDRVNIEPAIHRLRRQKDDDELRMIRKAIKATQKMYEQARAIVAPGISELEVYNQLQAAAVEEFGEPPTATGNDYQCASPGGPPRPDRTACEGELYILDLGPAYRGYFADNCRTFAVRGISDEQHRAWETVMSVFQLVARSVKPGASARDLYAEAKDLLEHDARGSFPHHLGHGMGLAPHEPPYLNPNWDDRFQEGEVFTVEPGLYAPHLKCGLRIEQNYLVTSSGIELLSDFPADL
jgi:Xaa-Pro aminopeptidase